MLALEYKKITDDARTKDEPMSMREARLLYQYLKIDLKRAACNGEYFYRYCADGYRNEHLIKLLRKDGFSIPSVTSFRDAELKPRSEYVISWELADLY